jgi:hypothetical protein
MDEPQVVVTQNGAPTGSMAERARALRTEFLLRETVVIEVAGYEGILAVEYRGLDWSEARKLANRNERVGEDIRELYSAADQMITASVNAYDVGVEPKRELGFGWGIELAKHLGVERADELTARQAVLACFPGRYQFKLAQHANELGDWFLGNMTDTDSWQAQDFPVTS